MGAPRYQATGRSLNRSKCHYPQPVGDGAPHEILTQTWRRRFSHFIAPVDGIDIHFIHEKGSGPAPLPLIISHGWPGTIRRSALW